MPWSMTLREFFELPIKQPDLFIYPSQSPTSSPYPDDKSTGPAVEMLEQPVTQKTLAPRQVEIIKAFDKSAKQFWHKDTVAAWVKRKPGNSKLEADFKLLADEGYLERQKGKGLFRRTDKPFPY